MARILPKFLSSFCPSSLPLLVPISWQPPAEVNSELNLLQARILRGLYCSFAYRWLLSCLPSVAQTNLSTVFILNKFPQAKILRNSWLECLFTVSKGHSHRIASFYVSSLDFLMRRHRVDTVLVILCPSTKSYCLFQIPEVHSRALRYLLSKKKKNHHMQSCLSWTTVFIECNFALLFKSFSPIHPTLHLSDFNDYVK